MAHALAQPMTASQPGERISTPYEGQPAPQWDDTAEIAAPLTLHATRVRPEWVDYNGHMSESCYLLVFGDSADAFFRYIGIDDSYRAGGHSLFTVETHLHHLREANRGDALALTLRLLDSDAKRLHIFHEMRAGDTSALVAAAEQLLLHVDVRRGKAAPLPEFLQHRLAAIQRAHAALPVPELVGRPLGIRHHSPANNNTADEREPGAL